MRKCFSYFRPRQDGLSHVSWEGPAPTHRDQRWHFPGPHWSWTWVHHRRPSILNDLGAWKRSRHRGRVSVVAQASDLRELNAVDAFVHAYLSEGSSCRQYADPCISAAPALEREKVPRYSPRRRRLFSATLRSSPRTVTSSCTSWLMGQTWAQCCRLPSAGWL